MQFDLHEVVGGGSSRVYVGAHERHRSVVAVVLDPEIESFIFEHISCEPERRRREA